MEDQLQASTMLPAAVSHSFMPPQPTRSKRRQVKNACTNCQKACKKCDDARPCLRCVKYGVTEACVDSKRKERKKGVKRGPYKKRDGKHRADTEEDPPVHVRPDDERQLMIPAHLSHGDFEGIHSPSSSALPYASSVQYTQACFAYPTHQSSLPPRSSMLKSGVTLDSSFSHFQMPLSSSELILERPPPPTGLGIESETAGVHESEEHHKSHTTISSPTSLPYPLFYGAPMSENYGHSFVTTSYPPPQPSRLPVKDGANQPPETPAPHTARPSYPLYTFAPMYGSAAEMRNTGSRTPTIQQHIRTHHSIESSH